MGDASFNDASRMSPMMTPSDSSPGVPTPPDCFLLAPGSEVVIEGLHRLPAFNGLGGVVQAFDEESGRYSVLLDSPAGPGGHQWAKVKRDNLRSALPPPPLCAPSLSEDHSCDPQGADPPTFPATPTWQDNISEAHALRLDAIAR